jgi:hypothetical protein
MVMASEKTVLSCEQVLDRSEPLTKLQSMLIQVGLYHVNKGFKEDITQYKQDKQKLTDSFVGKTTRKWLSGFCQSLPDSQKGNVIESLFLYSALKKVEPDCKAINNTLLLKKWFAEQKNGVEKDWIKGLLYQCEPEFIQFLAERKNTMDNGEDNAPSYYLLSEDDLLLVAEETTLSKIKQKAFPSKLLFAKALNATLTKKPLIIDTDEKKEISNKKKQQEIIKDTQQLDLTIEKLTLLAKKTPTINHPILNKADCGCLKNIEEKKITYHIYPGWLAPLIDNKNNISDEDKSTSETVNKSIDYSTISRIGFQGLSLNRDGSFNSRADLEAWYQVSKKFIEQAHLHYTKADIIIELENWKLWKEKTIQKAYKNIKLKVLKNKKLSTSKQAKNLDGITLYFPNYSSQYNGKMSEIAQVFLDIKKEHTDFKVNILLDIDICGDEKNCTKTSSSKPLVDLKTCGIAIGGILDKDDENKRCQLSDSEQKTLDYVLIFLPEKTTYTKKHLRKVIEEKFKGEARSLMLNKIIPIIMPYEYKENGNFEQFEDDIVYAKHNFGGVGFWPLPLVEDESFDVLQKIINKHLFDNASQNNIEAIVKSVLPDNICDLICTQRWYFRALFNVFVIFLVSSVFLKSSSCYICKIIDQHYRSYLSIWTGTILLFVSMLGCDRFWQERADEAMLGVIAFVVLMGFGNYIINIKKKQLP